MKTRLRHHHYIKGVGGYGAKLFVRIGMPMEPLFMRRVDEVIFGKAKTCDMPIN